MEEMLCPKCDSSNTYKSKKFSVWICEDCGEKFTENVETNKKWNYGLEHDEYWDKDFISVAPVSLAVSYQKLKEYVADGNIGCTLFLIRDVFELMIKIPVIILLDGVYSTLEKSDNIRGLLSEHPKFKALYANSMQILTTGKWWECVRLGSGLAHEFESEGLFSGDKELAYQDTVKYLERIYKMFWFQIPGQPKVNMVSWRNRAVGHSCLASNPEENYVEIPYILKMLKNVCEVSISYYQKVSLADASRNILNGTNSVAFDEQIFVAYNSGESRVYTQIHNFVAGKSENLSYYDGYEKGKAYLLNYADGDRYKDAQLSRYLDEINSSSNDMFFSGNNIDADNLETADIQQLEEELSAESNVVIIPYLYRWLIKQTEKLDKGIFLLQAECGMGKSTFCETLNQLSDSESILRYSDTVDGWADFMDRSAIRVWHFNSTYFGRKDVYISGIRDALLTLEPGHFENKKWIESNKIIGRLTSMWDSLKNCETNLRHIYFAEAMNATVDEYLTRTGKERIILVLDGIDELSDPEILMSYLPNISELNDNIFIVIVTRTDDELPEAFKGKELLGKRLYNASLLFMRSRICSKLGEQITEEFEDNKYYHDAVTQYIHGSFDDLFSVEREEIAKQFDGRFSEITAFKSLCKLNKKFIKTNGNNLLKTFIDVLRANSPEFYCKKIEMILNALAWSGSSLTIRELAYLSGEQYVSYRFIGMLHDLKAFIKVVRTDKGNCYEFSHNEWEQSVKEEYPYGDIYFRGLCNRLLDEIELESEGKDFFAEENQGELWILTNLLRLYNEASESLKKNWFEDVKIDNVSYMWVKILQGLLSKTGLDVTTISGMKVLASVSRVWNDYDAAVETFYYDRHMGVHCSTKNSTNSQLARVLIKCLNVAQTSEKLKGNSDYIAVAMIYDGLGKIYDKLAVRHSDEKMKASCALLAVECYQRAMLHFNKEKGASRIPDVIEKCYQSGRVCQLAGIENKAKVFYEAALKMISTFKQEQNTRVEFCGARICTRYGLLLDKPDEQYNYYISAEKFLCDLLKRFREVEYLSWRTRLYRLMALWNEKMNYAKQAGVCWMNAYNDAREVFDIRGTDSDKTELIRAMKGWSDLLIKEQSWKEVIPLMNWLIELDFEDISYLRNLLQAYEQLGICHEKEKIEERLIPLERLEIEYANAYQEVLEILKYTEDGAIEKIPKDFLNMMRSRANPKHGFCVDINLPFDEQNIMKRTKAILAIIFRDYWSYDKQKAKIKEHEERDLLEMEVELLQSVLTSTDGDEFFSAEAFLESGEKSSIYNEVDWILRNLPRNISKCIPISRLSDVVNRKRANYNKKLELRSENSYYEETIPIVKYLIKTYVPLNLIEEIQESVPEDFDLSIIFDNPEYEG